MTRGFRNAEANLFVAAQWKVNGRLQIIQVQNPDLLNPLKGIDRNDPNGRSSPTILSPDLVSPYPQQYNFNLEHKLAKNYVMRAGYIGRRSCKLLDSFVENRAVPVAGIALTPEKVGQRRPDARYYEVKYIVNAGAAFLDAMLLYRSYDLPRMGTGHGSDAPGFGNVEGRNTLRKGGIANFNAALTKQWRWGGTRERALLFRAEAFNLTNHPQFDEPQRNLSSPALGEITNTLNYGRVLQLGVRLVL